MILIFQGGDRQFYVKIDKDRNIYLNSEKTNHRFIKVEQLIKINYPKTYNMEIALFKNKIKYYDDKKLIEYIKKEFTSGQYTGYQLKHILDEKSC